ncbi:MAG: hypothetical protein V4559_15795 [Pseudomonadota bacterium]
MDNGREKFPIFLAPLLLGFAGLLALNWPGQMSYDTIVQLADGRSGHYDSWHPPVMAWLLGLADHLLPGPGLFLLFVAGLLLGAWWLLLRTGRPGWGAVIILLLIFATPQLLLYQGTVWKDVLFANAAIAGFACLAAAAARWHLKRTRMVYLFLSVLLLSLAALARQNGFVLLPIAALCLGMIAARQTSARMGWRYGAGLLAASLALMMLANFALGLRGDHGQGAADQLRLAQTYDLVGAIRLDPSIHLTVLEERAPALDAAIRKDGVALYSPHLVDTLEGSSVLTNAIYHAPPGAIFAQWRQLVFGHPGLYLRERLPVFGWVLAPPDLLVCHPDVVGVDGPPEEMKSLGLTPHIRAQDRLLYLYVARFFHTPVLSHLFYGAIALLFLLLLAWRGTPSDIAIAGLQAAALIFALSFFVVSIACDYRYLYFLDLAAMTGAIQFFSSARAEVSRTG